MYACAGLLVFASSLAWALVIRRTQEIFLTVSQEAPLLEPWGQHREPGTSGSSPNAAAASPSTSTSAAPIPTSTSTVAAAASALSRPEGSIGCVAELEQDASARFLDLPRLPWGSGVVSVSGARLLKGDSSTYGSCAVVGNSGRLLAGSAGALIDGHDAVFRINGGTALGFERYVGARTTHRVTYSPHCGQIAGHERSNILCDGRHLQGWRGWGPGGAAADNLTQAKKLWDARQEDNEGNIRKYPDQRHYHETHHSPVKPSFMIVADAVYGALGGIGVRRPSTGLLAIAASLTLCQVVDIYGFDAGEHVAGDGGGTPEFRYRYFGEASERHTAAGDVWTQTDAELALEFQLLRSLMAQGRITDRTLQSAGLVRGCLEGRWSFPPWPTVALPPQLPRRRRLPTNLHDFVARAASPGFRVELPAPLPRKELKLRPGEQPAHADRPGAWPRYRSCAVVASGGRLLDFDQGPEIDAHEAVFRVNFAPTAGFERHAGSFTTWRTSYVWHCGFDGFFDLENVLCHSPDLPPAVGQWRLRQEALAAVGVEPDPAVQRPIFMRIDKGMNAAFFKRNGMANIPTGGVQSVHFAIESCDVVNIYGFSAGRAQASHKPFKYHYYDTLTLPGIQNKGTQPHSYSKEFAILSSWMQHCLVWDRTDPSDPIGCDKQQTQSKNPAAAAILWPSG